MKSSKASAFEGSIASTSGGTDGTDGYWLDTQNSPGAIDITNWFHDDPAGTASSSLSFDIGAHDFGTGPMQETAADATFEMRIDETVKFV